MSRSLPFIQRRGYTLNFRIAVPADLRPLVGLSEVTRSLGTADKHRAGPLALLYAARVKHAFSLFRQAVMEIDEDKLKALMLQAKHKLQLDRLKEEHFFEVSDIIGQHRAEMTRVKADHEAAVRLARAEGASHALLRVVGDRPSTGASSPPPVQSAEVQTSTPSLSKVIDEFLNGFNKKKHAAMFKKHSTVLPLLLSVVGDKPVSLVRQADINRFFDIVHRLPPRWADMCRKQSISAVDLADEDHEVTVAEKTFRDSYLASVRSWLKIARISWQDQGFPSTLTTEGISYKGDRMKGENKQRAFRPAELERLFLGPELAEFSADLAQVHMFWLPAVALFTGARANEICQLNPQTDIVQETESGIWFFNVTEDEEADERLEKSVKNTTSWRKVPVHSRLVALGFLDYVAGVRASGSKVLFPAWKPSRGRASPLPEKWFRGFLREIGLRDETPGARIVGMHAFRSTLLNRAHNARPRLDATSITGHAGEESAVVRGYQGELSLTAKKMILEAIPIDVWSTPTSTHAECAR